MKTVRKWDIYEKELSASIEGNPFTGVEIWGEFSLGDTTTKCRGFYDGNECYKVRFMPETEGVWKVKIHSNKKQLDGIEDLFLCINSEEGVHGPVRVADIFHFRYEDGTNFYPFGTTSYVWNYQDKKVQEETIESLKKSKFNKIRMCIFPKYYDYNLGNPDIFPYEGRSESKELDEFDESLYGNTDLGFDLSRFNPSFFSRLENQIRTLGKLGIEADIILFHPYDRWGFSKMSYEEDIQYIKYVVARLSAFHNVWWSMANEYNLFKEYNMKEESRWDELFKCVKKEDPYNHLTSIHNWYDPPVHISRNDFIFDYNKPWCDFVCIQIYDLFYLRVVQEKFKKPIIVDECRYEGNLDWGFGNLTAEEMTMQFWKAVCQGAYAGHSEAYYNDDKPIWWSHGGKLTGKSQPRIAFLRNIIEENQYRLMPEKKSSSHWDSYVAKAENGDYLIFLGSNSQPSFKTFSFLDKDTEYRLELIDTWNMKIKAGKGTVDRQTRIDLPGKPYMALRLIAQKRK